MAPKHDSTPLWLWPNLLSLDAPLVAVLWQSFLAYQFSLPLHPAGRWTLGLTVWAIYLLDRLLDARKPAPVGQTPIEPARHRFYRRHRKPMMVLLMAAFIIDACVAILGLRPAILREGLIPLVGVLVYLAAFHISGKAFRIPKEIAAAILFTAGTFLIAWATLPCPELIWAASAFFTLCLANMIAIEAWERCELRGPAQWLANKYLFWVPAAVIACVSAGRNHWYTSIAISSGACALLFWAGRRLSLDARRALVDGVLLSPLLFLLLR
jgi:hypothetical protein